MKHFRFSAILIAFVCFFNLLSAQQGGVNWNNPLPTDPKVTIGELDNGMRYYIRSNSEPKNRAEFYIVHNVGAILEDDDQDGLAHFTEHMAFNGTKNYPKKGVLNFLENIGVKFGHNVNAFTGQDVTAYNLSNVPLTREGIIDSALLVLHDWSSYIAFEDEEIDAERGVIREEWRTRRTAEWRGQQEKMKYLYHGSKYAKRDVIGSIDVINNHEYETLKRFYWDWYRPDLQAIMIVGDFDTEMMEQKVIERFSKIPSRENKSPRPNFEIPNHKEPLVGVFTDSEITRTMVEVYYKHPVVPADQKNLGYYKETLIQKLYAQMLNARYNELVQEDNPPFVFAYSFFGDLARTKSGYVIMANARENEPVRAMKSMLEENYRLKQHGFTQTELDRAKADLLRSIENSYKERDKVKSGDLVWEYFSHFTENEPIPGIEFEYMFSQSLVPSISINEINDKVNEWITDENMVIFITAPEKEKANIPDKDGLLAIYKEVKECSLEPYEDNVSTEPLVSVLPKAGKVAKEKKNDKLETIEWELSNGVKVIVKPTDFKEDEILLSAYSPGGSSLVKESDVASAQMVSAISMMSGVGNHSSIDLEKMLAGKRVSVMPYVSENEEGFNGNSSPDDLEEMMQLVYLYFTNPRFDESSYNAYMSRIKAVLQNAGSSPSSVFRDSISFMLSDRNYRRRPMNIDLLDEVDFNALQSIYKDRFADASDFTFVLVGNIDIDELKPLVETYLASLPNIKRKETWKDNQIRFPKGETKNPFTFVMQVPKTSCFVAYQAPAEYNLQNMLYFDAIEHVLDLRYTETIREDEGGSYGVSSHLSLSKTPINQVMALISFDTDPDKSEHLVGIVHKEFADIIKQGPKEEDLKKAREYFLKSRQERLRENRFWSSAIRQYYSNEVDIVNGYEEMVKKLSTETVRKAASKYFSNPNMLEVIMSPEQ
ncbi:MAG: insulinase family protein [Bacteroidales bacterium]|nr:insulinase family protein [Bacteroidales bacterium]MDD3891595.1 insulinase family protein [Bacteroidales bacterium]